MKFLKKVKSFFQKYQKKNELEIKKENQKIENENEKYRKEDIKKFLKENPEFSKLSNSQILSEYYSYKKMKAERLTNYIIIGLTIVIALSTYGSYISSHKEAKAIEGSYLPQIFYSSTYCPNSPTKGSSYQFYINFGNYGKIPTVFTIKDGGENIESMMISGGVRYNNHTDSFVMLPIEYLENKQHVFEYNFFIKNASLDGASFFVYWNYSKREREIINGIFPCNYTRINDSFIISNEK